MSNAHAWTVEDNGAGGTCAFLSRAERSARCRQLADVGYLVARVAPVSLDSEPQSRPGHRGMVSRGKLRMALEGAVEISLALRGAPPPSADEAACAKTAAAGQLERVSALGAAGLCLVMPELSGLADEAGTLHEDDSRVLAVWRELCSQASVVLLFDRGDGELGMLAPQPLEEAFAALRPDEPCDEASSEDGEADDQAILPIEALSDVWRLEPPPVESHQQWHVAEEVGTDAPSQRRVMPCDPLADLDPFEGKQHEAPATEAVQPSLFDAVRAEPLAAPPPPQKPPMTAEQVRAWCADIDKASGPKPVSAIEELFCSRYAPLLEALGRGLDDSEAEQALERWRAAFERSYSDGFTALRVTGKRPTMVLDAPDVAMRIARQNGARALQLLLVDGMRYDLGLRVQQLLSERMGGGAAFVEKTLLWSALPTVTSVQLRLLAQGPRGLREQAPESDREPVVQRGKSITTLRRLRIGQRDLVKLDVAEARLREAGPGFDERMQAIAEEISEVVARFGESLAPRTLLFVFGDHGFSLPLEGPFATGAARQGGASPEEVLVGGFAWLTGDA